MGNLTLAHNTGEIALRQNDFERFLEQEVSENTRLSYEKTLAQVGEMLNINLAMPETWVGMTRDIIVGVKDAWLAQGYAIATINSRVATLKKFAALACEAGYLPDHELTRIRGIANISNRQGVKINRGRKVVRRGHKRHTPAVLTVEQMAAILNAPATTPIELRDRVIGHMLLMHGMRSGEVSEILRDNIRGGILRWHREKTDEWATHALHAATKKAIEAYLAIAPASDFLLVRAKRNGDLDTRPLGTKGVQDVARKLGSIVGVDLHAHGCRHSYANMLVEGGTGVPDLQQAGGWQNADTAMRYAQHQDIQNQNVSLGELENLLVYEDKEE